jgi:predicted O-methyltransferase YrrM
MPDMKPWMRDDEVKAMEGVIRYLRPARVLEWGAGGSTLHFSRLARLVEPKVLWVSVEHNPEWVASVLSQVRMPDDDHINLIYTPRVERYVECARQPMTCDDETRDFYDLILVDGIERELCLRYAANILSTRGVIVLHDASRTQYHVAMREYECQTLTEGDGRHQGLALLRPQGRDYVDQFMGCIGGRP